MGGEKNQKTNSKAERRPRSETPREKYNKEKEKRVILLSPGVLCDFVVMS
jgi:hypothetical protein